MASGLKTDHRICTMINVVMPSIVPLQSEGRVTTGRSDAARFGRVFAGAACWNAAGVGADADTL